MINLLPPHARHAPVHEYWARTITVWAFLIGGAVVFAFVLLVPTYVLVRLEHAALDLEVMALRELAAEADEAEMVATSMGTLAAELGRDQPAVDIGTVIRAIDEVASEAITLLQYRVEREASDISGVYIEGEAGTREALVDFETALETHALFADASIPLADLVRSQRLPFSVTITMADNVRE